MFKKYIIIFSLLISGLPIKAQQLVEGIAAVVGKEIILKTEIEQYVQNYIWQNKIDVSKNDKLLKDLMKQTLDRLVEQKILLAKAEEDTLTVDDAILDERVEQQIRYMIDRVGSESELEKTFGSPLKKIRKDTRKTLREQLLVEQVRSAKFRSLKISRREVEDFYATYKDSLPKLNETVDISHILMLVKPSDEALSKAYEKANRILEQLKNGADFAKLAELYSDDPASAKRGGDLGLISRGDFVPEFEAAAFNLKDGEISDIVQTQFGFHIIQMIERRGEKIRTRHILIQVLPTAEDEQRTVDKLKEIRQKALNGESFSDLALEYSDDENVQKDKGHLGTFETEKLVIPQFQTVVAKLKPGEISEPFKTDYGYHIVLLEKRNPQHTLTLENDWAQIENIALNHKMEKEYATWISELKKSIAIDIRNII
jgi:peptidyl-prolyl cis-trans isomerase SurA